MSARSLPPRFTELLRRRPATVALTGAGISAESGVPTFRDAQTGLWARYRPQDLATPEAFRRDPGLVWRWYQWRRRLVGRTEPNAAHRALAELQRRLPDLTLVTQNVDGLHERAGSRDVLNLHGSLWRNRCSNCGTESGHRDEAAQAPPLCSHCGGTMRPAVVWFGEALPADALAAAAERIAQAALVLVVGTSARVYPAAALAEQAVDLPDTAVVEINPERTPLSAHVTLHLAQSAATALPRLVNALDTSA